jgi:hypothetical protein
MGVLRKTRSSIIASLEVYLVVIGILLPLMIHLLHLQPNKPVLLLLRPLRQLPPTEKPLLGVSTQIFDNR